MEIEQYSSQGEKYGKWNINIHFVKCHFDEPSYEKIFHRKIEKANRLKMCISKIKRRHKAYDLFRIETSYSKIQNW